LSYLILSVKDMLLNQSINVAHHKVLIMTHLWIRAEERPNEKRVGVSPQGVRSLLKAGFEVTIEQDPTRVIGIDAYSDVQIAKTGSWKTAPSDAIIIGLKELADEAMPLHHRHVMFGHAYKDQPEGKKLLARFKAGRGTLYDLEYLTDDTGRRVAAFGYWAGYAGAAVAIKSWAAAQQGNICGPLQNFASAQLLIDNVTNDLRKQKPSVIIIGAKGRVGSGAKDFCHALNARVTGWDIDETAQGGPFPEILEHDIFLNCILANQKTPIFVSNTVKTTKRKLMVIGDIACDLGSSYSPIKVYDQVTTWQNPTTRVWKKPILDVTAIDNLPSLLPRESSEDFAAQLLPSLMSLHRINTGVWAKAHEIFNKHIGILKLKN